MEMSLTFDTMTKFNKKHTFWIGFIITFHSDIYFVWFCRGLDFAIVFGNDVIMMSFVIVEISN